MVPAVAHESQPLKSAALA